jgi:hypothetical protein
MNIILKSLAAVLEASGNYRVLRRLEGRDRFSREIDANPFVGIVLDTETTGMIPGADEVIELGMLKFEYGQDGKIYRVLDSFNGLQQPRKPIPAAITAITGITNEEVAGQAIDPAAVEAFVSGAALISPTMPNSTVPCARPYGRFSATSIGPVPAPRCPGRRKGMKGSSLVISSTIMVASITATAPSMIAGRRFTYSPSQC